jgi:hypothetical protein
MLSLLGIFIFVLAEYIFEYYGMGRSTGWSIFYFVSTYMGFTMVAIDVLFKETSKSFKYTAISFALFLTTFAIMELSFINVPFDEYIVRVNENNWREWIYILLAISLTIIALMAWVKRRWKK